MIALFLLWLLTSPVCAKSLGTIGTAFPIAEPDLLQVIQRRVALQSFDRLQAELNQGFEQEMDRPSPVIGLSPASQSRTWLFDPSVILSDDIKDEAGHIVIPAGQVVNPLDTVTLAQALLFYNADDRHQVQWAQQMDKSLKGHTHLILVGGSVKSQIKRFHKPVYFDQGGRLKERFQLNHVPTVITQEDRSLKIQEVILP